MEYSYERLETLISCFEKTHKKPNDIFVPDLNSYKELFLRETMNLKTYLTSKSFPIENERNFELLVHEYQSLLALWLDHLFQVQSKGKCKNSKVVFEMITEELQKLLAYIYERYERFFNLDEKVPEISLKQIREGLKDSVQKLRNHISKECSNETLVELALSPLLDILNSEQKKKITYRNLFYSKRIEKALANFNKEKYTGSGCDDKPMIELMVLMNYNNTEAYNFISNKIFCNIEMSETIEKKIDKLRFFLKEINQFKERPNIAYKKFPLSLKEQIVGWISEEIGYQAKGSLPHQTTAEAKEKTMPQEDKLHLSIPGDVIALMMRALKDNNVITNRHKTEVFKNLSKYVSTKHAETLSVNSLIKKSYDPERRAKDAAIDVLHQLIKTIHEY
jgi:hypothetical protein